MQQSDYLTAMRAALSDPRLSSYVAVYGDHAPAIAAYLWNIALCEAFYPSLHGLEVGLRNALHDPISSDHGPRWWDDPRVLVDPRATEQVRRATMDLHTERKPPDPPRIVAALPFGFWTGLFSREYAYSPHRWGTLPLWPRLLPRVFPQAATPQRDRRLLAGRLNQLRRFRNRVFHHESIMLRGDVRATHHAVVETLGWISPALRESLLVLDRVAAVHANGLPEAERTVQLLIRRKDD